MSEMRNEANINAEPDSIAKEPEMDGLTELPNENTPGISIPPAG